MTERMSAAEVAVLAEVDEAFVARAVAAGAVPGGGHTKEDASRLRLLAMWESAGLELETITAAVAGGELSFAFLDNPTMVVADRLAVSYEELAAVRDTTHSAIAGIHQALGFAPPDPSDLARADDPLLIEILDAMTRLGASHGAVLRLYRIYADALRRISRAELEFYESEIEEPLRRRGISDHELLDRGAAIGTDLGRSIEEAMLAIYRRHRAHVWLDHSVGHAEAVLESRGLFRRREAPPCVCFIDLTGYTQITEEQGDATAARLAGDLAALVEGISQRHAGRPVRWLGDGGMFVFEDPARAVAAAREVVASTPGGSLPATHIGIHCGPVVFQDGDVYGSTVNIAARLSALAAAGEIVVSAPVAATVSDAEPLGPQTLKGVARPMEVFRVR